MHIKSTLITFTTETISAEASDLGFQIGRWPKSFLIDHGTWLSPYYHFVRFNTRDGDTVSATYSCAPAGGKEITIFND